MRRVPLALLTAAALSLGCESPVTYSYFDVGVTLDPITIDEDFLAKIHSCAVVVAGARDDGSDLVCQAGRITHNLGHFSYSTSAKQGSLRFIVKLYGLMTGDLIAQGESADVSIVPNVISDVSVVVKAVSKTDAGVTTPDAGVTPDASAADSAGQ